MGRAWVAQHRVSSWTRLELLLESVFDLRFAFSQIQLIRRSSRAQNFCSKSNAKWLSGGKRGHPLHPFISDGEERQLSAGVARESRRLSGALERVGNSRWTLQKIQLVIMKTLNYFYKLKKIDKIFFRKIVLLQVAKKLSPNWKLFKFRLFLELCRKAWERFQTFFFCTFATKRAINWTFQQPKYHKWRKLTSQWFFATSWEAQRKLQKVKFTF